MTTSQLSRKATRLTTQLSSLLPSLTGPDWLRAYVLLDQARRLERITRARLHYTRQQVHINPTHLSPTSDLIHYPTPDSLIVFGD